MIASLMMYARPELDAALGRYWTLIRQSLAARGVDTPEVLSNDAPVFDVWEAPDLVLSQTCGLPFAVRLADKVQLVGTADFGLESCLRGHYRSALIVRAEDPREALADFAEARFVCNERLSQSGHGAMFAQAKAAGFWFADRRESGAHINSAKMIAAGEADIAAIDAMTWQLITRYDAWAQDLRVLGYSDPTPGLPYITGANTDAAAVYAGVAEAIAALSEGDRADLGLKGLVRIPKDQYLALARPPGV